jgi:CDP-glucose 4,6-dehydratase
VSGFWAGRRVLVTGHTGFKGSWLCLALVRAGAHVSGFSDGVPTQPSHYKAAAINELVSSVRGDIRNFESLGNCLERHRSEVVFHLAAQPLVRRSLAEPLRTYETNIIGTANVLEAIRRIDSVRAAVMVTTDKVYAPSVTRPFREDDRLGGHDPYSSSKACAELLTDAFRWSYCMNANAAAVATARAGNVIGGGDWGEDRLIPDLIRALTADTEVEIRYPDAVRPWQHVLNVIDGYMVLAERLWDDPAAARGWNFGPVEADARKASWIVDRVGEYWGRPLKVRPPEESQPPETMSLELDASQARAELGWKPRWNLDEALRATVEWYREHATGRSARALSLAQIDRFTSGSVAPSAVV